MSIAGELERLTLAAAIESNRILLPSASMCKYILLKCEYGDLKMKQLKAVGSVARSTARMCNSDNDDGVLLDAVY